LASGDKFGKLIVWNSEHGNITLPLDAHQDAINCVQFSPAGDALASASSDKTVKIWDIPSGRLRGMLPSPDAVYSVAFSPNGRFLASGSGKRMDSVSGEVKGLVTIWDAASLKPIRIQDKHGDWVVSLSFSRDSKLLASSASSDVMTQSRERTIRIWHVPSGDDAGTLERHKMGVTNVAFSPSGNILASTGRDWTLNLWDMSKRTPIWQVSGENVFEHNRVAFMPDGATLVHGSFRMGVEQLTLRDVATGDVRFRLYPHSDGISAIAISGDGSTIATCSSDHTIRLHRAASEQEIEEVDW
jgi:WD40 repeat protein